MRQSKLGSTLRRLLIGCEVKVLIELALRNSVVSALSLNRANFASVNPTLESGVDDS